MTTITALASEISNTATAERESDYYDSEYLADYYTSLWTDHPALKDIDVYWEYLQRQILSQHFSTSSSTSVVLDCGTGTGRVIHSLINKTVAKESVELSAIQFIGLDKSQFMLEVARRSGRSPEAANLSWLLCDVTSMHRQAALAHLRSGVDVLIFAFSGINHLHEPGQVDQFFASVQAVLKKGGLALVSVCTPLLDRRESYVENPFGEVKEVRSKSLPGIIYRERGVGQKVEGHLLINSLKTEVWQLQGDGSELVIERNNHDIPLRLFTREQIRNHIACAGLDLLEEKLIGEEVIYAIMRPKE